MHHHRLLHSASVLCAIHQNPDAQGAQKHTSAWSSSGSSAMISSLTRAATGAGLQKSMNSAQVHLHVLSKVRSCLTECLK